MEKKDIKEKLIEEVGVHFERTSQLSPLAARVYALLMLCPKKGHSFDELVELTKSSKSSVSTSINLLLNNGSVEYFTKHGERKRFFRLSRAYLKVKLKKERDQVSKDLQIAREIDAFNIEYNKDKFEKHRIFGRVYKDYLEMHYSNLESTINKMNQLEKTV